MVGWATWTTHDWPRPRPLGTHTRRQAHTGTCQRAETVESCSAGHDRGYSAHTHTPTGTHGDMSAGGKGRVVVGWTRTRLLGTHTRRQAHTGTCQRAERVESWSAGHERGYSAHTHADRHTRGHVSGRKGSSRGRPGGVDNTRLATTAATRSHTHTHTHTPTGTHGDRGRHIRADTHTCTWEHGGTCTGTRIRTDRRKRADSLGTLKYYIVAS